MRIAIDARMFLDRPTGIGRYIYNLVDNISKIDRKNDYVLIVSSDNLNKFAIDNIRLKKIKPKPMSVVEQFVLPQVLKSEKIDLFHVPSYVIPKYLPCKSVITLHDLTHVICHEEFGKKVQIYYSFMVKPSANRAKVIITDSESSKRDILHWLNIDEHKVRVIPLSIEEGFRLIADRDKINKIKLKYQINKKFILYNGNKKPHKNIESLIKAFYNLKNNKAMDYSLVIVGRRDKKNSETDFVSLDDKIRKLNLTNDVVYPGFVPDDDLALLYNAAELFVFPSLYEGFGLPPLEAMACGCPVVVSNISSLPEICGDAACYIDPRDIGNITENIYNVLTNQNLRSSLIKKGLERVKVFSWERCAAETISVYNEVLNS